MVNIANSAELRLKPSHIPLNPCWRKMVRVRVYQRQQKQDLIKGWSFLFYISQNLQGNGRFLEHHLEKAVKYTGAPAVTWVLSKFSRKRDITDAPKSEHPRTHAQSGGAAYPESGSSRHFSGVPLSPWLTLWRSLRSDASKSQQQRGRKCVGLWEHSKGEKVSVGKVWEETLTMWGGPCVCCVFFSQTRKLFYFLLLNPFLFYYWSIIEVQYYISFRCTT